MKSSTKRLPAIRITIVLVALGLLIASIRVVVGAPAPSPTIRAAAAPPSEEVLVPEGEFLMGCASDIWHKCDLDTQPIHGVYLDAFYIDKTEVTVSQYWDCVNAGACPPPDTAHAQAMAPAATTIDNHPITYVTWEHADAYCRWQGKRVPTEAEWEKAAHGPGWKTYPWGNEAPTCDRLNFDQCIGGITPVGNYPQGASPYGALDMAGNVREWVNDWYLKPYYARSPYYNPQGPPEEDTVGEHSLRGGSWKDDFGGVTTWIRLDEAETHYIYKAGIRCVRSAAGGLPTPTPTVEPTPFAEQSIDGEGAALWLAKPQHLTLVQMPTGSFTATTVVTLTYTEAPVAAPLSSVGAILRIETLSDGNAFTGTLTQPAEIALVFPMHTHAISGTLDLYRLDHGTWITEGITTTQWGANYVNALVRYPGIYGLLGETNSVYLPMTIR